MSTTTNSKYVKATPSEVYRAFTTPEALEQWLVPGEMTGKVHHFDLRVGGGYEMSLYYPKSSSGSGKTSADEDRYRAEFTQLTPGERITQQIHFQTDDQSVSTPMTMDVFLQKQDPGTLVTITFLNIPEGIRPEDNEAGTESSLQKLADLIER